MPRVSYDDAQREAIIKAATEARAADKTWQEAHVAAKAAGYAGSLQGIIKLIRALEDRKGKSGRKPGRPAGSKNAKRKAPLAAVAAIGRESSDIASLVNNLVKARINDALDKAIAVLQHAKA